MSLIFSESPLVLTDLLPKTTYAIRIQAINALGAGNYSKSVEITTSCGINLISSISFLAIVLAAVTSANVL